MNVIMRAVGVDSCVFQWRHEGSIFEALVGVRVELIELNCLGIFHRIPLGVDDQPTIKKAYEQEEKENV